MGRSSPPSREPLPWRVRCLHATRRLHHPGRERDRRAWESLQGLAVADALGARFEGSDPDPTAESAPIEPTQGIAPWTDDTQMALSVVDVLQRHGAIDQDALAAAFARRYQPWRGYGPGMHLLLDALRRGQGWRRGASQRLRERVVRQRLGHEGGPPRGLLPRRPRGRGRRPGRALGRDHPLAPGGPGRRHRRGRGRLARGAQPQCPPAKRAGAALNRRRSPHARPRAHGRCGQGVPPHPRHAAARSRGRPRKRQPHLVPGHGSAGPVAGAQPPRRLRGRRPSGDRGRRRHRHDRRHRGLDRRRTWWVGLHPGALAVAGRAHPRGRAR